MIVLMIIITIVIITMIKFPFPRIEKCVFVHLTTCFTFALMMIIIATTMIYITMKYNW